MRNSAHARSESRSPRKIPFERVVLLLQGGGALGAYQAGVYDELLQRGIEPTWVAGISIGAINSAIIAGNPIEARIGKLREFWDLVSDAGDGGIGAWWTGMLCGDNLRGWANTFAACSAMSKGVPGFFSPRMLPPYLSANGTTGATSWYETSALRATLERLVDFDRINARTIRFSVGAVNVRTGNFSYFDNERHTIGPEHIMASCALPPAFPTVEIDGEHYWDGGMVSNTPLDWVLSDQSDLDTLVLQVDLWSARGELPRDLSEVAVRMKEIQYSSRTRAATDEFTRMHELRAAFNELLSLMPASLRKKSQAQLLAKASNSPVHNIVQFIYRSPTYEGQSKDYEFSRQTVKDHWRAGLHDAVKTLSHNEVLELPTSAQRVHIFDFTTPFPARAAKATEEVAR